MSQVLEAQNMFVLEFNVGTFTQNSIETADEEGIMETQVVAISIGRWCIIFTSHKPLTVTHTGTVTVFLS